MISHLFFFLSKSFQFMIQRVWLHRRTSHIKLNNSWIGFHLQSSTWFNDLILSAYILLSAYNIFLSSYIGHGVELHWIHDGIISKKPFGPFNASHRLFYYIPFIGSFWIRLHFPLILFYTISANIFLLYLSFHENYYLYLWVINESALAPTDDLTTITSNYCVF